MAGVVLFPPYLQQIISHYLSPPHEDTFPGTSLRGGVFSEWGGQLAGDWEQGGSVHLWRPQKNGELALSSPASTLPFAVPKWPAGPCR